MTRSDPNAASRPFDPETPSGIRGWLLLVLLWLCLAPFTIGRTLYNTFEPLLTDGAWTQLTTPGQPAYHPLWAPLIVAEIAGYGLKLGLALAALWLFLRQSRRAPLVIIALLGWSLGFAIADQAATTLIPLIPPPSTDTLVETFVPPAAAFAVWVPYLLRSKRVRATFVF